MRKKAILLGLIGYAAGCLIGLCFALQSKEFSIVTALPHILLGGIPGAIAMGTVVIYDIEAWSLLRATVTHFLITMGALILACFVLDWFPPWSAAFWMMLAIDLAGYLLIWLIMYGRYKAEVRKLNELLKKSNEAETKK